MPSVNARLASQRDGDVEEIPRLLSGQVGRIASPRSHIAVTATIGPNFDHLADRIIGTGRFQGPAHGFERARSYVLVHNGSLYDPKA
jgi:hypothetical protein